MTTTNYYRILAVMTDGAVMLTDIECSDDAAAIDRGRALRSVHDCACVYVRRFLTRNTCDTHHLIAKL